MGGLLWLDLRTELNYVHADTACGCWHYVEVVCVADSSEEHAASSFRGEVYRMGIQLGDEYIGKCGWFHCLTGEGRSQCLPCVNRIYALCMDRNCPL